MKNRKKSQKKLREEFAQALGLKEYAEAQVRKTATEGQTAHNEAKQYLKRVEAALAEIGAQIK